MNQPHDPDDITILADAILDDPDFADLVPAMKATMTEAAWTDLAAALDVCPIHVTDIDTCADDDLDCRSWE